LFTILAAWLAVTTFKVRKQEHAAERIREFGGWVLYEYQIDSNTGQYFSEPKRYQVKPYGPRWLKGLIGPEFFNDPVSISLGLTKVTDNDLKLLRSMPELQSIGLEGTAISDGGLRHLRGLRHLKQIYLNSTQVTEDGIDWLRKEFPELSISYTPPRGSTQGKDLANSTFGGAVRQRESTRLGIKVTQECVVILVHPRSPAAAAGILKGDKVLSIEQTAIADDEALVNLIDRQDLQANIKMELLRSGKTLTVQVVLDGTSR